MTLYKRIARPLLFALEAERAHSHTLALLQRLGGSPKLSHPSLALEALGLRFPNPLGLAAGFDKDGKAVDPIFTLGFGFVEVGTVTPLPQPGNPKPRVFRLAPHGAIVNRLGFNSEGHAKVLSRLQKRAERPGVVGVNLGANKDSSDRIGDYVIGIETLAPVADYFTINVSSPNTPGLRDLQRADALADLLARVVEARERVTGSFGHKPVLLKIAPDLGLAELDGVVAAARASRIDGLIVSNTTIARPDFLKHRRAAREAGGLSGRPLFNPSTRLLAAARLRAEGALALVGVGGIDSVDSAWAKIEAGADLLQLYSAMAFEGPNLPRRILAGLVKRLDGRPWSQIVGSRAAAIAAGEAILHSPERGFSGGAP
ncbi:MAG TPA: quinone-dependent dihydroorotate dehydrogenase [Beijerinckiaceae bacterium]|nr:quinone-dependent dihydroorotate dehydrogenase [Beijerinckiaceae bacterium]